MTEIPSETVTVVEQHIEDIGDRRPKPYILVADDSYDVRLCFSLILQVTGAEVAHADNGQVAYEKAVTAWRSGRPFDVILMDVRMPVLDGVAAIQQLRGVGYAKTIIAHAAGGTDDVRAKCFRAGCDDYFSKPIDSDALRLLVAQYVKKS